MAHRSLGTPVFDAGNHRVLFGSDHPDLVGLADTVSDVDEPAGSSEPVGCGNMGGNLARLMNSGDPVAA